MNDRFFGAHTIDNGGIDMAVRRAHAAGMRAMQLFSAIPKFYNEKVGVKPERVERFRAALAETDIRPEHVMVHAAYVLNTASSDEVKASRAKAGLAKELERSTALGVLGFCFHPGSAGDGDPDEACARVGAAITHALETVDGSTRVLIENTAGAGRTMGRTATEIAKMLAAVPKKLRGRAGYGLDTCHLFASGHDIAESPSKQRAILDEFEKAIGEPPSFFHLNDSATGLGTNRDRHVLLGEGEIGAKPFEWLVRDPRTAGVPLILETPQQQMDIADDDGSPDPYDLRMMGLLLSFGD
jgi:deoxyribonuclease-4